jgi:2',3'-cyclic-nucleotide 2'-phosphodiesterase (5'-nucleotidase family)
MRFDGVGIGSFDLAAGINLLMATRDRGLPWISANIYDRTGVRIFPPYRIVEYGDLEAAIVAVTDPVISSEAVEIRDAERELSQLLPSLGDVDIIILLSSLPFQQTVELAERHGQIDLAITADRHKKNLQPVHAGSALVFQTAARGQYMGMFEAKWRNRPWMEDKSTEIETLKGQLASLSRQIARLAALPPDTGAEKAGSLQARKRQLLNRIDELENSVVSHSDEYLSTYRCTFIPLSASVRKDPAIEQVIRKADKRIRELRQPR